MLEATYLNGRTSREFRRESGNKQTFVGGFADRYAD